MFCTPGVALVMLIMFTTAVPFVKLITLVSLLTLTVTLPVALSPTLMITVPFPKSST